MKIVVAALMFAAVPALALAHGHGGFPGWPGSPAPAPELAAGLPAVLAVVGAVVGTRFKRR